MDKKMFCFQCEQTVGCTGCTGNAGVCGKKADTPFLSACLYMREACNLSWLRYLQPEQACGIH